MGTYFIPHLLPEFKKFLENNSNAKIVGVTNKKNLVFEFKGNQIKISPEGLLVWVIWHT